MLYWDRNGFALWTKRLEKGRFRAAMAPNGRLDARAVEYAELALVLEGIELAGARRRPRWVPRKASAVAMTKVMAKVG